MGYPALQAGPSGIGVWGWDTVKRHVRLANMETNSVLNDEKPASKAAILNLPGNQFWGYNGTAGYTLPAFTDSPMGPFVG